MAKKPEPPQPVRWDIYRASDEFCDLAVILETGSDVL
jgi:hypothetical protein